MRFPAACLLVFAKAPVAGAVKTRLIPRLGPQGAAHVQERLITHTLATVTAERPCPVELWCAPSPEHPFFRECAARFGVALHAQEGADLGARMAHALAATLERHHPAVLVGSDCLVLSSAYIERALGALARGAAAVLGPTEDGGYALIGLARDAPELFGDIAWGTDTVLAETRARLRALGRRWHELQTLWDLDRPEDLDRLGAPAFSWLQRGADP